MSTDASVQENNAKTTETNTDNTIAIDEVVQKTSHEQANDINANGDNEERNNEMDDAGKQKSNQQAGSVEAVQTDLQVQIQNDANDGKEPVQQREKDYININEVDMLDDDLQKAIEESKKDQKPPEFNKDYYDEQNRLKYDAIIQQEEQIRLEQEKVPLISDLKNVNELAVEFAGSIFEITIQEVINRYSSLRYIRRDGNCFYRSFIFRLFEHVTSKKDKKLYDHIIKVVEGSRVILEEQGYQWLVVEDFYNVFYNEWKLCYSLDPQNSKEYLNLLFQDKEKSQYMIVFIRMFISAFIKQNRMLYESFIEEDLDSFCQREVEGIDRECDQIQMIAVTNAFEVGVQIESLTKDKVEEWRFPEDMKECFVHMLFRPGHYDILYPK